MIQIPLTQTQFETVAAKLRAEGEQVVGTSGQMKREGVILGWTYDGTNVTATVLRKPPFFSLAFVAGKVTSWFTANEGPAAAPAAPAGSAPAQPAK